MLIDTNLETEIRVVYRGPLDEFVSRRDALVKQLRAAKRSDDAARVKALRKPSRMAWLLDAIVDENPSSIERLVAAITEAQTGADLRAALDGMKTAVRDVAAFGARIAVRAGHPVEPNAIALAVHAVIGDANAFAELRAGRLVDVPEGGGLDMLSALTVVPPSVKSTSAASAATHKGGGAPAHAHSPAPAPAPQPPERDLHAERIAAARAGLDHAEQSLADARRQSEQAAKALSDAADRLDAAERALHNAQAEAKARRDDVARARKDAESAAENLRGAERTTDAARSHLTKLDHPG